MGDTVNKERYLSWEKRAIRTLFAPNEGGRGHWPIMTKKKVVLFAYVPHELESPPVKTKLQLWHGGKRRLDGVSYGRDGDVVKLPAMDTGGLTNAVVRMDEPARFVRVGYAADPRTARYLYRQWKAYSGKRSFYEGFRIFNDLQRWVTGVHELGRDFRLGFWEAPTERYVVVPCADARRALGREYYLRNRGSEGSDDDYARALTERECSGLYIGLTDRFVTPNLSLRNLRNEFVEA